MVDIDYLPEDSAVVRNLAEWHQDTWGHLTGRSVEERIREFAPQRENRLVPLTLVARLDGALAGSASLLPEDMDTHPDLSPWLASVFVSPDFRRRGIGARLCTRIVAEAARLGYERLYLFTEDREAFYQGMGWRTLGQEIYHGEAVTLMEMVLNGEGG